MPSSLSAFHPASPSAYYVSLCGLVVKVDPASPSAYNSLSLFGLAIPVMSCLSHGLSCILIWSCCQASSCLSLGLVCILVRSLCTCLHPASPSAFVSLYCFDLVVCIVLPLPRPVMYPCSIFIQNFSCLSRGLRVVVLFILNPASPTVSV